MESWQFWVPGASVWNLSSYSSFFYPMSYSMSFTARWLSFLFRPWWVWHQLLSRENSGYMVMYNRTTLYSVYNASALLEQAFSLLHLCISHSVWSKRHWLTEAREPVVREQDHLFEHKKEKEKQNRCVRVSKGIHVLIHRSLSNRKLRRNRWQMWLLLHCTSHSCLRLSVWLSIQQWGTLRYNFLIALCFPLLPFWNFSTSWANSV